jgi:hypothetical protein
VRAFGPCSSRAAEVNQAVAKSASYLKIALFAVAIGSAVTEASATCGTKGGPGYRGPNGKCVGWAEIARVCGSPPTTRCTPELSNPRADNGAALDMAIEGLRPRALGNQATGGADETLRKLAR